MWNTLTVDISLDDLLARPVVGAGGLTRGEARAGIQASLDADPTLSAAADQWRTGAQRVRVGSRVWTTYEHDDDSRAAALTQVDAMLAGFRDAGIKFQVTKPG